MAIMKNDNLHFIRFIVFNNAFIDNFLSHLMRFMYVILFLV